MPRFITDRKKVHGLGSAHSGTGHWWQQRLTALALAVLGPIFIFLFARALGAGPDVALATFRRSAFGAFIAFITLPVAIWHFKLGLQVVIEDYVHEPVLRTTLLILNTLGSIGLIFYAILIV